jgi:hypothetical protein
MKPLFRRCARRVLQLTCCIAFGTKLLIPDGYMPSPIADGWPIRLCDSRFHPTEHSQHHGHEGNQKNDSHEHQWKYCPLGALAAAGALPGVYQFNLQNVESAHLPSFSVARRMARQAIGFQSRAPPDLSPMI